jgi:hypothetical protein
MSHPFTSGRMYDIYFSESESELHEKNVAFEDILGSFLIFVRKAGVGETGLSDDQRVFIPFGWVRKAVELPNISP